MRWKVLTSLHQSQSKLLFGNFVIECLPQVSELNLQQDEWRADFVHSIHACHQLDKWMFSNFSRHLVHAKQMSPRSADLIGKHRT